MQNRPGEIPLNESALQHDAWLTYIGHIETPYKQPKDCPRNGRASDATAHVRLKPDYRPALKSLSTCSHVIVFYWMHQANRSLLIQSPSFDTQSHGTFALRSPHRPNPIAMSVVELLEVLPDGLKIRFIDCIDQTPLIDIKPYFAHTDSIPDARVGWYENRSERKTV